MEYRNITYLLNNTRISKRELNFFRKFLLRNECYIPYLMRISCDDCWLSGLKHITKRSLIFDPFPWYTKDDPLASPEVRGINKLLPENVEWIKLHYAWMGHIDKK